MTTNKASSCCLLSVEEINEGKCRPINRAGVGSFYGLPILTNCAGRLS
ncbi:unnamed protein product, partial [Rotaria magnacalcarata]